MEIYYKILDDYLVDDNREHDIIVDLANKLGIDVNIVYSTYNDFDKDFFALTIFNSSERIIMINVEKINSIDVRNFILSYQLAEVIKTTDKGLYSFFEIENLDMNIYKLAKKIFDRSNKYKEKKKSKKKKLINL